MAESADDKYEDVLIRRQLPLSPLPEHLEDRHISLISVLQLDAEVAYAPQYMRTNRALRGLPIPGNPPTPK